MSKKRILSNGHSSYWRDDLPKVEPKEAMHFVETDVCEVYTGLKGLEAFERLMKEEISKYINQKTNHEKTKAN
jgi:hypothetical protein